MPYKPLKSSAVNVHLSSCVCCVCYVWEALYKVGDNRYLWPIIIVVFEYIIVAGLLGFYPISLFFQAELKTQEAVCGSK